MTSGELERLRAERDALLEHDVSVWLDRVRNEGSPLRGFESSISYRVTAPLRWGGILVRKVRSDGLGDAVALVVSSVKKRVRR